MHSSAEYWSKIARCLFRVRERLTCRMRYAYPTYIFMILLNLMAVMHRLEIWKLLLL